MFGLTEAEWAFIALAAVLSSLIMVAYNMGKVEGRAQATKQRMIRLSRAWYDGNNSFNIIEFPSNQKKGA